MQVGGAGILMGVRVRAEWVVGLDWWKAGDYFDARFGRFWGILDFWLYSNFRDIV